MAGAKSKNLINLSAWADYEKRLETLGERLLKIVGQSLKKSAEKSTEKLKADFTRANYPAHAEYSTGLSQETAMTPEIVWLDNDTSVLIRWGLDLKTHGEFYPAPIFLIYGTPIMTEMKGVKNDLYSSVILASFQDDIEEAVNAEIERIAG